MASMDRGHLRASRGAPGALLNRREPIGLRLNWLATALFSFFYFQYELNRISREKDQVADDVLEEAEAETSFSA